jgi:hypothetical protein
MWSQAGIPQADPSPRAGRRPRGDRGTPCTDKTFSRTLDSQSWRAGALIYAGLWAVTAAGALLGALAPALAPGGPPHPTLRPTPTAAAAIVAQNCRVLAAPFLLAAARFNRTAWSRLLGDVVVTGIVAGNALLVGLALGRWQGRLLRYLPHLPLEYLAAATAASGWTSSRRHADARQLCSRAAVTVVLLFAAAAAEVLLTPHAP